jgi:hypothetical protein
MFNYFELFIAFSAPIAEICVFKISTINNNHEKTQLQRRTKYFTSGSF